MKTPASFASLNAGSYNGVMTRAYEEIIDFIAAGTSPQSVTDFRPSDEARQRVSDLIAREKSGSLTPDETAELDHYLQLEHLMRLAKARARKHLGGSAALKP